MARGNSQVQIADLNAADDVRLTEAASVLFRAMDGFSTGWPTPEAALGELIELARISEGILLIALDDLGRVRGVVGAQPMYPGQVMELHPLAVDPDVQRGGIGAELVAELEARIARAGYSTIMLGTDDEAGQTSLAGIDLYPDPLAKLAEIASDRHPFNFYRKIGYAVVGVTPDASGFGKPDIWMAKRLKAAPKR